MPLHRVYDVVIESSVSLPELPLVETGHAGCRFRVTTACRQTRTPRAWSHHWRLPDGTIWTSFARLKTRHLIRFPELADFLISTDGTQVECRILRQTPESTIRHLFLDQVLPLILSRQGKLVLHASAVVGQDGAIAFAGVSGMGKSTLSTSFCQQGYSLLADDGLLLEEDQRGLLAIPGYPGVRLWEDMASALFGNACKRSPVAHYTEKMRVGADAIQLPFCSEPVLVRRIYLLSEPSSNGAGDAIAIHPLAAQEGFMELVRHTYRLDLLDKEKLRDEFVRLSRVIAVPLFRRLEFPRKLELLPEVRAAILRDLAGSRDGG